MKPFARRKPLGRTPRRVGASTQGQLATWTQSVVDQLVAERSKAVIGARAADLYSNDAMAHGLLESMVVEAVGVGLTPQFSPDHEALGASQAWADQYVPALSRLWSRWGMDCRCWCDAQRRLDIYGLQQLLYFSWRLAGIGIAQVVIDDAPGRPSPLAVLPIDPSRLVTPTDAQDLPIYDGIEVNDFGAPVRAWLVKPGEVSSTAMGYRREQCTAWDVRDAKTGLPRILLVTGVRHIAEYRQDSVLSPMITELRNNTDLIDAAIIRALISNTFVMFVENQAAARQDTDDDWRNRIQELKHGLILQGSSREIPHFFDHKAAPDGYREMFDSIVDRLGMASVRGSENVARKFQASYSASKASMVKAEQVNRVEHMTLKTSFCQPMLMWLAYEHALRGALPVPGQNILDDLYHLTVCDWLPQPMPEIDRAKRANAIATELETGQITYSDIYGEQSKDWRRQRRQRALELAHDKALEQEFGITFTTATTPAEPAQDQPAPDGSDLEKP